VTEQSSYRRLAALAHAGHQLAAVGSLDEAVDVVARCSLELLRGDSASVGRIDAARGLIRVLRNRGDLADWEEEQPDDEVYPLGDFPWLDLPPERATAWYGSVDDAHLRDPERELLEAMGKRSMLTVPLVVDRTVWGMIAVVRGADRPRFDAEDLAAGEALGGMVGAALARMEERSELRALAFRDPLTGLANRRAVDDRLDQLFASDPPAAPVGVVLCDVNGLKVVNDVHGHHAGDALLREVARVLSAEAGRHPGAVAARLGGDEFCLVVEDGSEEQLEAIAGRLTERADTLELGRGLSCGVAVADRRPGDARTSTAAAKALLRLADAAQYRVKRRGGEVRSRSSAWADDEASVRPITAEAVQRALAGLAEAGGDLVERLVAVAVGIAEATNAGAWALLHSHDGGPVVIVRNVDRVRTGDPDARDDPLGYEPSVAFDIDAYPATRTALAGGELHATLTSGDSAERALLAASGCTELAGAGRPVGSDAWLVAVCGDALSVSMRGLASVLRVLIELAVTGADPDGGADGDEDRAARSSTPHRASSASPTANVGSSG